PASSKKNPLCNLMDALSLIPKRNRIIAQEPAPAGRSTSDDRSQSGSHSLHLLLAGLLGVGLLGAGDFDQWLVVHRTDIVVLFSVRGGIDHAAVGPVLDLRRIIRDFRLCGRFRGRLLR